MSFQMNVIFSKIKQNIFILIDDIFITVKEIKIPKIYFKNDF